MANPDPHIEELNDAPPQQLHQDQLQPQQEDEIVYEEGEEVEDEVVYVEGFEEEEEEEEEDAYFEDDEDEDGFDDAYFEELEDDDDDDDEEEEEVGGDFTEDEEDEEDNPIVNGTEVERGEANSSSGLLDNIEDSERNGWNRNEIDGLFCPICMEAWTNDGDHHICCLPCGHIYGMSCINRWLQQRRNSAKCPQCNKKCTLKDVKKLFASRIVAIDEESQQRIQSLEAKCASLESKRIQSLEAKCASLESKNADWRKKAAEWQKREAELCLKVVQYMERNGIQQGLDECLQNHGHVLGMGVGIEPRDVFGDSSQSSGKHWTQTQQLEEYATLNAKIGHLKAQLQLMQTDQAEWNAIMQAERQTARAEWNAQIEAQLQTARAKWNALIEEQIESAQAKWNAQIEAQMQTAQLQLMSVTRPSPPATTTTDQTVEDEQEDDAHMEDNS